MNIDRIQFYKEFYFKELSRKVELDNAINIPIFIISTIISINVYYLNTSKGVGIYILTPLAFINSIYVVISIYRISESYFNLGEPYKYSELEGMNEQIKYDKSENKAVPFEDHIEESLANAAGINFKINKERTEKIAECKKILFKIIMITLIATVFYIFTILINNL